MTPRRFRQSGDGKIGCIIWLAIFGLAVLIAVKMIPVKIRTAELEDYMVEQARWAERRSPEQIRGSIVRRAQELDLPLGPKGVTVKRTRGRVQMSARYTVPVEFPGGYVYRWEFYHEIDRPIFYF